MIERHTKGTPSTARAVAIIGAALGLGILFDLFFYGKLPGVAFPLYIGLVLLALGLLARTYKAVLPRTTLPLAALSLFFAFAVAIRASEFVTFLNVCASLYLLIALAYSVFRPRISQYRLATYLYLPLETLGRIASGSVSILAETVKSKHTDNRPKLLSPAVIRGTLIALPILLLFAALFASADLVFRQYLSNIFIFDVPANTILRLFWIAAATATLTGFFAIILRGSTENDKENKEATPGTTYQLKLGATEASIVFGSLNLLFFGFIIVQLAYLFGGEQNIAGQGFTYAEYARKGFFELIAVAIISFLVITTADKLLLRKVAAHSRSFKVLANLLIAQVLVVMTSAFTRLSLYEGAYGFTTLRLYAHIAIVWLGIVFIILAHKIITGQRENILAFRLFASAIVLLAVINIINVDGFVARKNVDRYFATGKLDNYYLYQLSTDAIPQLARLAEAPDKDIRTSARYMLESRRISLEQSTAHWQSTNLSRTSALNKVNDIAANSH